MKFYIKLTIKNKNKKSRIKYNFKIQYFSIEILGNLKKLIFEIIICKICKLYKLCMILSGVDFDIYKIIYYSVKFRLVELRQFIYVLIILRRLMLIV